MTKVIFLTTSIDETRTQTLELLLVTEAGKQSTMDSLRAAAATLLTGNDSFLMHYMDSDGDEVTIASDADVKELLNYMADEELDRVTILVTSTSGRADSGVQTQLHDLVTVMSKQKTEVKAKKATPANAINLLVACLQTMDVAEEMEELATIKKELLTILEDGEFKKAVECLCACDEFKSMTDVMVAAVYEEDAQGIEAIAMDKLDELLKFVQCVVTRCPTLKPVLVNVAKQCINGLVRRNDEKVNDDGFDLSEDCSSSTDDESRGVEAQERPVHVGIICDGCEKTPLIGVRYKPLDRSDFDLCEDCEASGKWVSHEPFIKITDPLRMLKHKRTAEGVVHPCVVCDGCEMNPIVGTRFKSETAEDFDLCEACEASGKWTERFGPFTKIQEPGMMHDMKPSSRRGGKFRHHGKNGHHHGHHGKFSHLGLHGPPGVPFKGPAPHLRGPRGFFGIGSPHDEGPPRFPRHDHRSPRGFPGYDSPSRHEGAAGFAKRGEPPHHEAPRDVLGNDRVYQDVGCPDSNPHGHRGHGPSSLILECNNRPWCHHGLHGCGPPGFFGRSGALSGFLGSDGPSPFPPDFSSESERSGFRGSCGQYGRRGRYSENEEEQQKKGYPSRRRGCRGRGRWGRDAVDLEARFLEDVTIEDGTVVEAEKPLRKMWKLVNNGERAWPDGCYMIAQRENPMLYQGRYSSRIEIPALAPGEEFIAGVDLVAPKEPGRYASFWRVCDPAGVSFGHRFWIDIEVAGVAISEATTSEAPTTCSIEESDTNTFEADLVPDATSDDDIETIAVAEAQEAFNIMENAEAQENDVEAGAGAAAAAAAAENSTTVSFERSLVLLASMGFADSGKNFRALELAHGDVCIAVNALLSE